MIDRIGSAQIGSIYFIQIHRILDIFIISDFYIPVYPDMVFMERCK